MHYLLILVALAESCPPERPYSQDDSCVGECASGRFLLQKEKCVTSCPKYFSANSTVCVDERWIVLGISLGSVGLICLVALGVAASVLYYYQLKRETRGQGPFDVKKEKHAARVSKGAAPSIQKPRNRVTQLQFEPL